MKDKKLIYIIIAAIVILLSIGGYVMYRNSGTYNDLAGEWQLEKDYSDEDNINHTINKMLDQVADELDVPNTESLKITRDGEVTITSNGLALRKSEASYSLPEKRDKNTAVIPVTFELSKIEESPLYGKFFPSLLQRLSLYGTKNVPFEADELADYKEMLDKSTYSEKEMDELAASRKEEYESNPDTYKKVSISGDKLTYEFHPSEESNMNSSFKIVNKNKIEFIASDGETVMATYVRK